jgi:hypothetical protein
VQPNNIFEQFIQKKFISVRNLYVGTAIGPIIGFSSTAYNIRRLSQNYCGSSVCPSFEILKIRKSFGNLSPPLWSSGQSSCPQTQRSRVRFTALPDLQWVWKRVHSALVRINEELFERKVAVPVYKTEINDRERSAALTL